ncbi:hypothetical protein, partial [Flavobacterium sp.]|uniref:hypothetical protein n=1 Tax=Flavobacterium sp. TaxID=239 RepID=UPI002C7476B6
MPQKVQYYLGHFFIVINSKFNYAFTIRMCKTKLKETVATLKKMLIHKNFSVNAEHISIDAETDYIHTEGIFN